MTSSIAKDKDEGLKIQRIMKIVRKTYIKPEFHDVRIGEEALCGDINIGINTSSSENYLGSMGARANDGFDDEMEEINDDNYINYNDYTGFNR
ncbi:MAG: hypothetical protein SPF96_06070 [Prevotella sp.]|nr:hypothetical protein [Prevotella sp.]